MGDRPSRPARLEHLPDNVRCICNTMRDCAGVSATGESSDCTEPYQFSEIGANLLSTKKAVQSEHVHLVPRTQCVREMRTFVSLCDWAHALSVSSLYNRCLHLVSLAEA